MRVKVQKWGSSAAVRVPALALKDAGMQVGQALEMRVEKGRLIIEPAGDSLEDLLGRITSENSHGLSLDDASRGAEAW